MNEICPWGSRLYASITPPGASRFRYSRLPDELKPYYLAMEDGLLGSGSDVFGVRGPNAGERCARLFLDLHLDNPLLFDRRFVSYTNRADGTTITTERTMDPYESASAMNAVNEIRDRMIRECSGMSDYRKELAVHDYIVSHVRYDMNAPNAHSMIGALVDGRAVCEGIALAAEYLLCSLGVDAGVVIGQARGSTDFHAWNIVHLGSGYHMDATSDIMPSNPNHSFFNIDDRMMSLFFEWSDRTNCRSLEMNYHSVNGSVARTPGELDDLLDRRSIGNGLEFRTEGAIDQRQTSDSVRRAASRYVGRLALLSAPAIGCYEIRPRRLRGLLLRTAAPTFFPRFHRLVSLRRSSLQRSKGLRSENMRAIVKSVTGSKMTTEFDLSDTPNDIIWRLAQDPKNDAVKYLFGSEESFENYKNKSAKIDESVSSFAILDGSETAKNLEFFKPLSEQMDGVKINDKEDTTFVVSITMTVGSARSDAHRQGGLQNDYYHS